MEIYLQVCTLYVLLQLYFTFSSDTINAEVIRQIESCLFIVCLDDSPQASAI